LRRLINKGHSRRLHLDWAARPALMGRAAHAVESKAVVRTEVAVSPRPCLGCAVELVLRVAPLRRGVPPHCKCFEAKNHPGSLQVSRWLPPALEPALGLAGFDRPRPDNRCGGRAQAGKREWSTKWLHMAG
jgi:hypothetical protein